MPDLPDEIEAHLVEALDFLCLAPRLWRLPHVEPAARRMLEGWRGWRIQGNVVGMGVAVKTVRGSPTSDLALKVYVERKLAQKQLPREARVPARLKLPHLPRELLTDVEEIGPMSLEPLTARVRPALPGYSVAHERASAGTLGAVVQEPGDASRRYILSNSHVLALSGLAKRGDAILQPGPADGGGKKDRLASLERWVAFDFGTDFVNCVDAALARPRGAGKISPEIPSIGIPVGVSHSVQRGMTVQKTGRTTGHTIGVVRDVNYRTALLYPRPVGGEGRVSFRDQVLCSRFTAPGDSGSLVLDSAGQAVGLHFAGSPSTSVFNPLGPVLAALRVELVVAPSATRRGKPGRATEKPGSGAEEPGAGAAKRDARAEKRGAGSRQARAAHEEACRRALQQNAGRLMALRGVVGAGVGIKEVRGQATGEPAVIVYVEKKKSRHELPPADCVPAEILFHPALGQKPVAVSTDVVEVGPLELEAAEEEGR